MAGCCKYQKQKKQISYDNGTTWQDVMPYEYQPGADEVITWCELVITAVAVLASGFVMMLLCSWLSVNKFLRMRAGELYKI